MKKLVLIAVLLQLCLSVLDVNAGGGASAGASAGGSVGELVNENQVRIKDFHIWYTLHIFIHLFT